MGSYFARNTLKWTLAADNLDHWLEAGGLQDPALIMDHTLIMDQEPVIGTLVDKHYDVIVDGIKKRLLAPPGVEFPASPVTITGPFGDPIVVNPAESPLRAGGEETLYYDSSTPTTGDSTQRFIQRGERGPSGVASPGQVGGARHRGMASDDRRLAGLVLGQLRLEPRRSNSCQIPLNLFDRLPADMAPFRSTIEDALKRASIDPVGAGEITVTDAQMSQIEGKKIAMPDGSTMQPKAYPIYSDGSWSFDASTCDKDTVLTIPPP